MKNDVLLESEKKLPTYTLHMNCFSAILCNLFLL